MSHYACPILNVLLESIHRIFVLFLLNLNIQIVLRFDYLCPMCHISIFSFVLFLCLTHIVLESIHQIVLLFWGFLLKYSNITMIWLPMSDTSQLDFFIHLITYSEKPNFDTAICHFCQPQTACQSHSSTAPVYSHCPQLLSTAATVTAAAGTATIAVVHNRSRSPSVLCGHSPSAPCHIPPLPLSAVAVCRCHRKSTSAAVQCLLLLVYH